jgi:L-fuculose-phosphate aldolase
VYQICGRVALAPYACPGTQELGERIAETFASGADCVLLENHGVVVGGRDLMDAFQRFETLEFAAFTLLRAAMLGPLQVLPPEALAVDTMPVYGDLPARTTDVRETGLRTSLSAFVHRAYRHRLLISTAGAFSARLEGDEFLITPRRRDRLSVRPEGIVRVRGEACSAGQQPSRAARLHAEIYARHPSVGAVVSAQPAHATAYCVTDAPLSTHTIPESYLVLNEVGRLPFLRIVEDAAAIAAALSPVKTPVVLVANEGAVVVGRTLLEAFDRLEVLEATTEAILLAKPLGAVSPMPAAAIAELRRVFNLP